MHRLVQEMGRNIVRQESTNFPAKRSRVWLSTDSYKILSKRKGSKTIEGLALDMKMLPEENFALKSYDLQTEAFKKMVNLKLLKLNFVELSGSYEYISEDLRWLCLLGFHLTTIPSDLYMGNLVAIDMSYSNLEVFEPPMDIQSLKILNLKDSHHLTEIRNMSKISSLETLILWNCYSLVNVCENLGDLSRLTLLNLTGCKTLFNRERKNLLPASTSSGAITQSTFSFPCSLHRLFLKDCHLERTVSFPLSFSVQLYLQYLNLSNSRFESLPCYDHLTNLRVLDLSFCSRLKCLLCLPSTLAELYIYYCELLERITFQSHRFTLQEFGYEGCNKLYEVEGFVKLIPIAKLDETDLGHLKWLKEYEKDEVCLIGDDELVVGRSRHIQVLYEFDIMSTSLKDIRDPRMIPNYTSESSSLSFDVPSCPKNRRLKGINITFKYAVYGDDWAWFCKVSTTNGVVDLMYNPKVFGKPEAGEVCIWLSYWPIGSTLNIGDTVNVSIFVMSGLKVFECGVSLVYYDKETMENNTGWAEILGGDLSAFELSTGAYYLCRRDFFELMEARRLTPDWFRTLVGDTIDYTEIRGWRKTGRPKEVIQSFTELKTIRCILDGSQLEDAYKVEEMLNSTIGDKTVVSTSGLFEGGMKSGNRFEQTSVFGDVEKDKPPAQGSSMCRFTYAQLVNATDNFKGAYLLGEGGYGKVYKGNLEYSDQIVAIKKLYPDGLQGTREFVLEVLKLGVVDHPNIVKLIGYCAEEDGRLLVYEYMPSGSLEDHLHGYQDNSKRLDWNTRMKIAAGAARGLQYIHDKMNPPVIYGDLKSSNILLGEDYHAKLSNLRLGRPGDETQPSYGYRSPEYAITGQPTFKSDIYSFGVVLLELITGRKALDITRSGAEQNLVAWARPLFKDRRVF